jgi:hypothetical protein
MILDAKTTPELHENHAFFFPKNSCQSMDTSTDPDIIGGVGRPQTLVSLLADRVRDGFQHHFYHVDHGHYFLSFLKLD